MRPDSAISGSEAVAAFIRREKVDAELIRSGTEMRTVALAAAALGVRQKAIVKSIVFEGKRTACVGVALASGNVRIDCVKVAKVLGLPALRLASPEIVKRFTGYDVGGVPPFGYAERLPVVVDSGLLEFDFVFGGGGDERHMLRISPREIVRITGAIVAEIASVKGCAPGKEVA